MTVPEIPGIAQAIIEKAKSAYYQYIDDGDDGTIHCNRYPSWEELSLATQATWILKVLEHDNDPKV